MVNDEGKNVYVDDNWTVCDDDAEWETFHAAWNREFDESANVAEAADDFCGVLTEDLPGRAVALSSKKLLQALAELIQDYLCPSHVATPMLPDSPFKMREVNAPVREELITKLARLWVSVWSSCAGHARTPSSPVWRCHRSSWSTSTTTSGSACSAGHTTWFVLLTTA